MQAVTQCRSVTLISVWVTATTFL
ncbi:MAG: hypothetical protein QOD34_3450, partial [Mycobacterium sp.]|nr:hypothetical protein [Mycobacterium sp.]